MDFFYVCIINAQESTIAPRVPPDEIIATDTKATIKSLATHDAAEDILLRLSLFLYERKQ